MCRKLLIVILAVTIFSICVFTPLAEIIGISVKADASEGIIAVQENKRDASNISYFTEDEAVEIMKFLGLDTKTPVKEQAMCKYLQGEFKDASFETYLDSVFEVYVSTRMYYVLNTEVATPWMAEYLDLYLKNNLQYPDVLEEAVTEYANTIWNEAILDEAFSDILNDEIISDLPAVIATLDVLKNIQIQNDYKYIDQYLKLRGSGKDMYFEMLMNAYYLELSGVFYSPFNEEELNSLCEFIYLVMKDTVVDCSENEFSDHIPTVWNGTVAEGFAGGDGTQSNPFKILTAEQLAKVNTIRSNRYYYELVSDIYLNEKNSTKNEWTAIGSSSVEFKGYFNGNGYTIYGLYINKPDSDYQGLFGYVAGGISNVKISEGTIIGKNHIGGICGYTTGSLTGCSNSCSIIGVDYIGGIAGGAISVKNCYNSGTIKGTYCIGGIAYGADYVYKCYNTGNVAGETSVAGICPSIGGNRYYSDGEIVNCYNTGYIKGKTRVGGICSYTFSNTAGWGYIKNCYNTGTVEGEEKVGGILGENYCSCAVFYSFNLGKIIGNTSVGGICGYSYGGGINDCYAICTVEGKTKNIGGICGVSVYNGVGVLYDQGVNRCFYSGNIITDSSYVGGVCTSFTYEYTWCGARKTYYNSDLCVFNGTRYGDTNTGNISTIGLTTDELTGSGVLEKLGLSSEHWVAKANSDDGTIKYYPQLKAFPDIPNFSTKLNKITFSEDVSVSYHNIPIYSGDTVYVGQTITVSPMVETDRDFEIYINDELYTDTVDYVVGLSDVKIEFILKKYKPEITPPVAINDLVYTGEVQNLIYPGTTTGGTMVYKLDDGEYSPYLPFALKSGIYTIYYKVEGDENYEDVPEEFLTVKIAVPTPKIEAIAGDENILIKCELIDDVSTYRIQRFDAYSWHTITYSSLNAYIDIDVTEGVLYQYRALVFANGIWSPISEVVSATPYSSAPKNITAISGDGKVTISWSAVDGATKYRVQRLNGTTWSTINYPTEISYVDTNVTAGTAYKYRVLAYVNGVWSSASSAVSATPKANTIPQNVKAEAGDGEITISWSAVKNATKYRVQRYNGSSWATVKYPTATSYTDTDVTAGTAYKYRVLAYVDGAWGKVSSVVSATPTASTTPQNVKAVAGDGKITISWSAVSGATKYRVQRLNGTTWSTINYPASTSYVDTNVTNGTTYKYRVLAYVDGVWGKVSSEASATPVKVTTPQNVKATAGEGKVTINWSAVTGATKYRVQRLNGTSWSTISYPATNSYVDTDVTAGTTYKYRVLAYVDGAWSAVSAVVTATLN